MTSTVLSTNSGEEEVETWRSSWDEWGEGRACMRHVSRWILTSSRCPRLEPFRCIYVVNLRQEWRWKRGCTVAIVIKWPFSTEFYFARDAAQSDVVFEGCVIGNSISPPHRGPFSIHPANWTFLSFSPFHCDFPRNCCEGFFQLYFSLFFLALSSGGGWNC